jgi:hypothetical protein
VFSKARAETNALYCVLATELHQTLGGVDVALCAYRTSAARLSGSCSHVKRVFGAASSAGSEDWVRFDVAWPVVMQDRTGDPKRAARASALRY